MPHIAKFGTTDLIAIETTDLDAIGIYEIDGDRLKICLAKYQPSSTTEQRPKGFEIEPNSRDVLLVLERRRVSKDEIAIQGQWMVASQIDDGEPRPEYAEQRACTFDDDFIRNGVVRHVTDPTHGKGRIYANYWRYVLDPAAKPKKITIDAPPFGVEPGRKTDLLGIYKFDGDRLTIAYRQGGPRPEKFESTPGSGVTLLVLEKPKPAAGPKPDEPKTGESQAPPSPATQTP